jgi:hypothetical protein
VFLQVNHDALHDVLHKPASLAWEGERVTSIRLGRHVLEHAPSLYGVCARERCVACKLKSLQAGRH